MLPRTCDQLPCRNIELMSVGGAKYAGTTPNCCKKTGRSSRGNPSSYNHASPLRTMMVMVRNGTVRDGMTSRSGIMQTFYEKSAEGQPEGRLLPTLLCRRRGSAGSRTNYERPLT